MALLGFGAAAVVGAESFPLRDLVVGALIFAGPWLVSFIVSPASIGFGDVKLSVGLGLYLGWLGPATAFLGTILTAAIGGGLAILVMVRRRGGEHFPFGPALVGGAVLAATVELAGR